MNLLVVVDMQYGFTAANKRETIVACRRLVNSFKKNGDLIVFLEYKTDYRNFFRTRDELTRPVRHYENYLRVNKDDDDGSWEVNSVVNNCAVELNEIHFCGVNAHACVASTIYGVRCLQKENEYIVKSRLVVHADAVGSHNDFVEETLNCFNRDGFEIQGLENTSYSLRSTAA